MWRKTFFQNINVRLGSILYKKCLQILCTMMYQKTCIFHSVVLGIPSSLVLLVKNRRMMGRGAVYLTDKICYAWQKLFVMIPSGKDCSDIIRIQKQIRILKGYLVKLQALWTVCLFCCFFFVVFVVPIQQWPCHNNVVAGRGLNRFDDCAAECVGRRVYLFSLGTQ